MTSIICRLWKAILFAPFATIPNILAHFHTGGNPGRHEIDQTQELNYHVVAKTIADLGFAGVISHEYTPVGDPLTSLKEAIEICTV